MPPLKTIHRGGCFVFVVLTLAYSAIIINAELV